MDFSLASNINHPLVQMCLKINAMTTLPPGLTYAPSGIPYGTGNVIASGCANNTYMDGDNYNFCYLRSSPKTVLYFTFVN